ncbi:hypothetical protein Salat_0128400 [Sesamum alatum]|uniref:Uncharacterized protein n=1 Tax=Sesamum alatum TaxID=300844 RepID=A0AAE2CXC2_9LAMI|nr:hypothetical protein Salat_0128400 [Sesamum alatum]
MSSDHETDKLGIQIHPTLGALITIIVAPNSKNFKLDRSTRQNRHLVGKTKFQLCGTSQDLPKLNVQDKLMFVSWLQIHTAGRSSPSSGKIADSRRGNQQRS